MKIKDNPQLIVILPVVGGIALIASGIATGSNALLFAGIGVLFGGSFLTAVIMVVCIMLGNKKPSETADESKQSGANDVLSEVRRRVAEKNGETSAETQAALDKIADSVRKRERSENRVKVLVVVFIVSFILVAMVGVGLMSAGLILAGGITFGCAPLMIVSLIVGAKIKERIANAEKRKSEQNYDRKVGRVTQCKADGSGTQTIYKVYFLVNNHPYSAFSKVPYNDGDKVEVSIMRNGRDALIVGPAEYSFVRGGKTNSVDVKRDEPYVGYDKNRTADKTESREEKEQMGAVLGSIWELREAAKIQDEDEQRAARKAARKAMFEEFEKFNAIRAQKEKSKKESVQSAATEQAEAPAKEHETPPSLLTSPDVTPDETHSDTEQRIEERNTPTPPSPKRATVAYKGINRKK